MQRGTSEDEILCCDAADVEGFSINDGEAALAVAAVNEK